MKEGNIKLQFPLKKGWKTSLGKRLSCLLSPLHGLVIFLKKLNYFALCLAQRRKRKRLLGGNPIFFLLFLVVLMIVTTVATSMYLYFQALCQVYPLIARKFKSCDMLSKNRLCQIQRKIHYKS